MVTPSTVWAVKFCSTHSSIPLAESEPPIYVPPTPPLAM